MPTLGDVELTREQFMALADAAFGTATSQSGPHAQCPQCHLDGAVTRGETSNTVLFAQCGHAFGFPADFLTTER